MTKKELKKVDPIRIAKIVMEFSAESGFWSNELGGYRHQWCFHAGDYWLTDIFSVEKIAKKWLRDQLPHWDRKRVKMIWAELNKPRGTLL